MSIYNLINFISCVTKIIITIIIIDYNTRVKCMGKYLVTPLSTSKQTFCPITILNVGMYIYAMLDLHVYMYTINRQL